MLHYSSGAPLTALTMNNLIDAYKTWESTSGFGWRNLNTALERVTVSDLTTQNGLVVDRAIVPAINGTVAGETCPNNVTIAVGLRTGLRGRSFRGRIYHIGFATSMTSLNQILPTDLPGFITNYSGLLTLGVAPIFHLQVLSYQTNLLVNNPAVATPVTGITVDVNLDSQRRRLPGHNRHR